MACTQTAKELAADRIIVALDCDIDKARELAGQLLGHAKWLKVGMTMFYAEGPAVVKEFKEMGYKVFVDLKLHDIPHQIKGAARSVALTGADLMTIHASGGAKMIEAALEGAALAQSETGRRSDVIAVTVLTSMDDSDLASIGVKNCAAKQVELLGRLAASCSIAGVVCSAKEAKQLSAILPEDAYIVTPGIRPAGSKTQDQLRVATPASAISDGATHLVIGRPITEAPNPLEAFEEILDEVVKALA